MDSFYYIYIFMYVIIFFIVGVYKSTFSKISKYTKYIYFCLYYMLYCIISDQNATSVMHRIVIKLLPFLVTVLFEVILGWGVYSKPSDRSKMELFVKIIQGFQFYSNQQNFHYMKKCFDMNLSPYLLILKGFF